MMLVEMNTNQMIDKLTEIQVNSGRDFPILFAEAAAPHVMASSAFISMVCDINRIAKPAAPTQPKVNPEVVTMDDHAESEPKIEVVASNDAPAQEESSDNKTEE